MDNLEFSSRFDLLYNNITSNQAPGLNEWEKSVLLTKAQDEVLKDYFSANSKGNNLQIGFDSSPKRQADFSTIIKTKTLTQILNPETVNIQKLDMRSALYKYPEDLFISINEQFGNATQAYTIVPISYEEYSRLMAKPYKYPPKNQIWRLITGTIYSESTEGGYDTQAYLDTDYVLAIKNISSLPVRFIVNLVEARGTAPLNDYIPTVSTTASLITITCNVPKDMDFVTYWRGYLSNPRSSYYASEVFEYVGAFTGDTANHDSSWPSIDSTSSEYSIGNMFDLTVQPLIGTSSKVPIVELIGRISIQDGTYRIRYVRNPKPIILVNLVGMGEGLSINGYTQETECELPEHLHEEILQRAVELAKVAWTATGQDNAQLMIQAGQRSE